MAMAIIAVKYSEVPRASSPIASSETLVQITRGESLNARSTVVESPRLQSDNLLRAM
jgi:hypothetical protein